jgi:hypothetical protein
VRLDLLFQLQSVERPPHLTPPLNQIPFPLYLKKGELKDRRCRGRRRRRGLMKNAVDSGAVSLNNLSAALNGTQAAVWLLNN